MNYPALLRRPHRLLVVGTLMAAAALAGCRPNPPSSTTQGPEQSAPAPTPTPTSGDGAPAATGSPSDTGTSGATGTGPTGNAADGTTGMGSATGSGRATGTGSATGSGSAALSAGGSQDHIFSHCLLERVAWASGSSRTVGGRMDR